VQHINVSSSKTKNFASPQLTPRREQNNQSQTIWHGGSKRVHLRDSGHWPFRCMFGTGTVDFAWGINDHAISHSSPHDC
jgi:hypothetical protein